MDILLLKPGYVSTDLLKGYYMPLFTSSSYGCVFGALRDLGQVSITQATIPGEVFLAGLKPAIDNLPAWAIYGPLGLLASH